MRIRVDSNGNRRWNKPKGVRYRTDGPALEYNNGHKEWWLNNKLHREDGPAIEWDDGGREWWFNDKRHREDGPAIEYADGTKEYYLEYREYTEEEYWKVVKNKEKSMSDFVQEHEDHSKCCFSTGIHEGLTVGQGELDQYGYWERPCPTCARKEEKNYPDKDPVWPFEEEK